MVCVYVLIQLCIRCRCRLSEERRIYICLYMAEFVIENKEEYTCLYMYMYKYVCQHIFYGCVLPQTNCKMVSMKRYMQVSIISIGVCQHRQYASGCIRTVCRRLTSRGFPHQGEFQTKRGGETTRWGDVRKSKKIQMYRDRFKSLVEYCDDVYACDAYARICYVI